MQRKVMDATPDLSRLNAAEREVLALLAQGHTAKSVAARIGRSEGSVNERLREARRKTGVGSSRELARLVRAQENRDEEIGVSAPEPAAAVATGAPIRARLVGALVMTNAIGILVATALKLAAPSEQTPPSLFLAAAGIHQGEAESWRAETRAQTRNPAWADAHEAVLRRGYAAVPAVDMASLQIDCRESKCEVIGRSSAGASPATLKQVCKTLVSPTMRNSLIADGLRGRYANCGGYDVTHVVSFLGYWVGPDD